jgi:hypothetical protein
MKYTNEKKLREVYFSLLIHSINFVLSLWLVVFHEWWYFWVGFSY